MTETKTTSKIDVELIRIYFKNGATGSAFPVALFAIIFAVCWDEIPLPVLLPWVLVTVLTNVARLMVARQFLKKPRTDSQASIWAKRHTAIQFINALALAWGVFVFFMWASPPYQSFYTVILFALIAGGALTMAPYRPAMFYVAPPILISLGGWNAAQGDKISMVLGACMLFLLAFIILMSINTRRLLTRTIELRLEKEDTAEQLKNALQEKNLFLARASHDLRQPLHAMTLFNAAAEAKVQDGQHSATTDNDILRLIRRTGNSIGTLSALINSLLDVSKLDADEISPELTNFLVQRVLTDVYRDLAPEATQKGLSLCLIPSTAIVRSDPVILGRIVRNLVSNAVRYTLKDRTGTPGKVLMGCRIRGDEVSIEIWDTGMGIPENERDNIFTEFTRLPAAQRHRQEGIGLGLSIVKRMSDLLGHKLTLRSKEGHGTVFSLSVPRVGWSTAKKITKTRIAPPIEQITPVVPTDPNATRIAVIDNDPDALLAMSMLLTEWGCAPIIGTCAHTTAIAVRKTGATPDLILADYELDDGLTGVEAITHLRAEFGSSIPAALITGRITALRRTEAASIDVTIFAKPLRTTHLQTFVAEATA